MSGTRGGSNDAALPLIATEEIAGEQYQKVKIVNGAAGQTEAIGGDATNGLDVDVTRVQGTVTVAATDLDIRHLLYGTDTVGIHETTIHGSALGAEPMIVVTGGKARGGTPAGAVSEGDAAVLMTDLYGRLRVITDSSFVGPDVVGYQVAGTSNPVLIGGRATSNPVSVDDGDAQYLWLATSGAAYVQVAGGSVDLSGSLPNPSTNPYVTRSDVAASATSVTISSGNPFGMTTIFNDSTVALYLDLTGGTATTSSFSVKVAAGGYYEVPFSYSGAITGLWDSATGNARVTWFSQQGWD